MKKMSAYWIEVLRDSNKISRFKPSFVCLSDPIWTTEFIFFIRIEVSLGSTESVALSFWLDIEIKIDSWDDRNLRTILCRILHWVTILSSNLFISSDISIEKEKKNCKRREKNRKVIRRRQKKKIIWMRAFECSELKIVFIYFCYCWTKEFFKLSNQSNSVPIGILSC